MQKPLRKLMWEKGNLHVRVQKLRTELMAIQEALDKNPDSVYLRIEESAYLKAFNEAKLEEEEFLKQKSKIQWLKEGDLNTGYFHKVVKGKQNRSIIQVVRNSENYVFENENVIGAFVEHYENFLGKSEITEPIINPGALFVKKLNSVVLFGAKVQ